MLNQVCQAKRCRTRYDINEYWVALEHTRNSLGMFNGFYF